MLLICCVENIEQQIEKEAQRALLSLRKFIMETYKINNNETNVIFILLGY